VTPDSVVSKALREPQSSVIGDVEVLSDTGEQLVCLVANREVAVPCLLIQPTSEVRHAGDHGKLVIPRWLAIGLGLTPPFTPT
jgi:hypothetical protein